jgi:hypothetical protein
MLISLPSCAVTVPVGRRRPSVGVLLSLRPAAETRSDDRYVQHGRIDDQIAI